MIQRWILLAVMLLVGLFRRRGGVAAAWSTLPTSVVCRHRYHACPTSLLPRRSSWRDDDDDDDDGWGESSRRTRERRRRNDWGGSNEDDESSSGRWIRNKRPMRNDNEYRDDDDDTGRQRQRPHRNSFTRDKRGDPPGRDRRRPSFQRGRDNNNNRDRRWDSRNEYSNDRRNNSRRRGDGRTAEDSSTKIDMKALEAEFVHLYGLSPILSALKANRRNFAPKEAEEDMIRSRFGDELYDNDDDDDNAFESSGQQEAEKTTKPEAQFTPWLFLQDRTVGGGGSGRSGDKMAAATKVTELAGDLGIPVAYTDKGSLNTLSGNRPHQGFVLRCGALEFEPLSRVPHPEEDDPEAPPLWLVLDEVVDPQNLGALLRSSFFLGAASSNHSDNQQRMGILVCSKNSAPPSPVVSAASAGALELLDVYSTSNLPRTLKLAQEDGFRIIGAASSLPRRIADESEVELYDLQNLPPVNNDRPTLLVLGSEGHGLRTLVAKHCTEFVRIPRGHSLSNDEEEEVGMVDSLNVSVTGGILLWHLLFGSKT